LFICALFCIFVCAFVKTLVQIYKPQFLFANKSLHFFEKIFSKANKHL